MNPKMDELIRQWLDGDISEADAANLLAELGRDPELLREIKRQYRVHRLLGAQHDLDAFGVRVLRSVAALRDQGGAEMLARRIVVSVREEADAKNGSDKERVTRPVTWRRWILPLAAAASVAIVAGVWWFNQGQAAGLGLRVAEIQRSEVRVQRSGGESVAAAVGLELRQGDRVVVGKNGMAGLKYDGEETKIELRDATVAAFGSEKGAKRVRLDGGKLVCTAAPQKKAFEIKTPHAMARVVGTRFSLDVTALKTVLAVMEGKVELIQGEKILQVSAGQEATASDTGMKIEPAKTDAAGLKKLSPEDAWIRELLVRAEAGSWSALDFKRGTIFGATGSWHTDLRGEPAGWRIWQTDPAGQSMVFLEGARWKRGVIVGRVMMLPEGELPSALAVPAEATAAPWKTGRNVRLGGDLPNGVYLGFHWGSKMSLISALTVKDHPRGVWHRFAVYFDTTVEPKTVVATALGAWPEDRTVPSAALWSRPRKEDFRGITGNAVGLGLYARQVPVLWQGIKVVPLGPDLPPLPPGVGEGK